MLGENSDMSSASDMHDSSGTLATDLQPEPLSRIEAKKYDSKMKKLLPYLALNEVIKYILY